MAQIVVFVTTSSEEEAVRIGRSLVEAKLAACANVLPGVRSIFRWEGTVSEAREALLVVKSRGELFEELAALIKGLHSYKVPEIIALSIVQGSPDYLSWIRDETRKSL